MSLLSRSTLAANRVLHGRSSRLATAGLHQRFMSVVTLEGGEEIEKFRMTNAKSVLYFTATWCPPCKVIKPIYENLSKENTEVAFGLVDVDDNSDASLEFQIRAVPTFVFFHGENAVERMSGADSDALKKHIEGLKAR